MSDVYEERQNQKKRWVDYIARARRLFPAVSISNFPNVQETASKDGAFVEGQVWVPATELATPSELPLSVNREQAYVLIAALRTVRYKDQHCKNCLEEQQLDAQVAIQRTTCILHALLRAFPPLSAQESR